MGKKKIAEIGKKETAKPKKETVNVKKPADENLAEMEGDQLKKPEKKLKTRGKNYLSAKKKVGEKTYEVAQAVKLAKETSFSKFTGNLEVHLLIDKKGDSFEIKMPYFKGKEKKVVVLTDKIVADIKAGKIEFDILVASPKQMPQIVPFAKVLGPKGLMPNPKNGTLVDDPEKVAKKLSGGGVKIKTEKKQPVVHLIAGKLDQPDKELIANVEAVVKKIGKGKISKISFCATMGPGIRVSL
jgi:large subunit ribosomal protein L1